MKTNLLKAQWMTGKSERLSYSTYFMGQNMIYMLVTSFLTTFLLFRGIDPLKSAAVILAVKVWDAVNDAIFGCVFDSIKFKSGKKFMPWIKISLILIPLATVLLFMIPAGATEMVQLVWLAVAYILWDTAYTLCDVPIFGLVTAMTDRLDERSSILSIKSLFAGGGSLFAFVLCTVLVSSSMNSAFLVSAIILAVLAFILMLPICFKGKERVVSRDEEKFTLRRMCKYVVSNRYLLVYILAYLFISGFATANGITLFVSYYLFNNSMFSLVLMALGIVPTLVFAVLTPKIVRRFDKMKVYFTCMIAMLAISIIIYFVGYKNVYIHLALVALKAVPLGISGILLFMFTPDCAEYGTFKTGIDAKGITFAIQTFIAKLTAAISGALSLMLIGLFDWTAIEAGSFGELAEMGIAQSPTALGGLWFTYALFPAIGVAIGVIVLYFYKLRDKDVQLMADCNSGRISKEEALSKLSIKLR